jgi:hypothetical protein
MAFQMAWLPILPQSEVVVLSRANLKGAIVTPKQLWQAESKSLVGATLPIC